MSLVNLCYVLAWRNYLFETILLELVSIDRARLLNWHTFSRCLAAQPSRRKPEALPQAAQKQAPLQGAAQR
eukprot:1158235-Amphidinium_carterae.1